jgi:hypothetical protein
VPWLKGKQSVKTGQTHNSTVTSAAEDQSLRLDCKCCVLRFWNEGKQSSLVRHANNYEIWPHQRDQFPQHYTCEAADE